MAGGFDSEKFALKMRELRKLKEAREHRQVTQREVADAVGVAEVSISNYECGTSAPTYATAWRIADYYGVTLDELGCREFEEVI
jgi:transcriptional regulator with XRE-family HTH domain